MAPRGLQVRCTLPPCRLDPGPRLQTGGPPCWLAHPPCPWRTTWLRQRSGPRQHTLDTPTALRPALCTSAKPWGTGTGTVSGSGSGSESETVSETAPVPQLSTRTVLPLGRRPWSTGMKCCSRHPEALVQLRPVHRAPHPPLYPHTRQVQHQVGLAKTGPAAPLQQAPLCRVSLPRFESCGLVGTKCCLLTSWLRA